MRDDLPLRSFTFGFLFRQFFGVGALLPRTVFQVVDRCSAVGILEGPVRCPLGVAGPLISRIEPAPVSICGILYWKDTSMTTCSLTSSSKFSTPAATKPKETRSCDTLEICVQTNMSAAAREVQASPRKDATRAARSSTLYFFSFRCGHDQDVCRHLETNGSSHSWPDSFVDSNFTRRKHSTSPLLRFLSRHNISNYHHRRTANRKLKKPTR